MAFSASGMAFQGAMSGGGVAQMSAFEVQQRSLAYEKYTQNLRIQLPKCFREKL